MKEIDFDVYGSTVKGKFLSFENELIRIEVIYDSVGVSKPGDIITVHKSHLKDMSLIDILINQTPLETRLKVDNEMNLIDFLTEIGFRKNKSWTEEENELLEKTINFAKKMTESQLKTIEVWEKDGKPK